MNAIFEIDRARVSPRDRLPRARLAGDERGTSRGELEMAEVVGRSLDSNARRSRDSGTHDPRVQEMCTDHAASMRAGTRRSEPGREVERVDSKLGPGAPPLLAASARRRGQAPALAGARVVWPHLPTRQ